MAQRTGVPTILALAKRLCILITRYSGIIALRYPANPALVAALAAANAACAALADELDQVREYGD